MSSPKEFERSSGGIVSKAEREQQLAARPVPKAELHLTPPGWDTAHIQLHLAQEADRRMKHIDERLKLARENFEKGHARALVRGQAKKDFDRGR